MADVEYNTNIKNESPVGWEDICKNAWIGCQGAKNPNVFRYYCVRDISECPLIKKNLLDLSKKLGIDININGKNFE